VKVPEDVRLAPAPGVATQTIDGGAVLVNMASGQCFELNKVGLEIWHGIEGRQTPREIHDVLAGRYDVDSAVLMLDVANLLEALVDAGLAQVGSA
jgi:hypothetical protein